MHFDREGGKDAREVLTMRLAGRISAWNDDKGYGFATPSGGGDRAFVHIKAFQPGSRRPGDGDLLYYEVTRDARRRSNAAEVRFPGPRIEHRKPARSSARVPRAPLGAACLLWVLPGAVFAVLPSVVVL